MGPRPRVPGRLRALGGLAVVLLAWSVGLAALQRPLDAAQERLQVDEEAVTLPSPRLLKPALLGYHDLVADLYWLRTIQYFGKHLMDDERYPLLAPLLDFTTGLDPQFVEAYAYGHLFLLHFAEDREGAIALLRRGIAANPRNWELAYDLGRIYYLDLHDDAEALKWFERADRLPGRPEFIHRFVARMYAATGQRETAVEMWRQIYETTPYDSVRAIAERELKRLGSAP